MEQKNFNFTTILLVGAAFAIGMLFTKIQYLEKKPAGNNNVSITPDGQPTLSLTARFDIKVGDNEPIKGDKNAKITIVEYSDFQCPACSSALPAVDKIINEYKNNIRLVYRQYPLDKTCNSIMQQQLHPFACKAAEASLCALDQGKFWEMHDKMFDNQEKLDVVNLKKYATEIGIDVNKFSVCLDGSQKSKQVVDDLTTGNTYGVNSTPSFFVNGKKAEWLTTNDGWYNVLKRAIEAELKQ